MLTTLYYLILDALDALLSHFGKRNEPMVTFILDTVRRQVIEFMDKASERERELMKEVKELKQKLSLTSTQELLDHKKILENQRDALQERIQKFSPELWQDEIEAIKKGDIIPAIKLYRQRTGMGLRDSKDAIEGYMQKHKLGIWTEKQKTGFSKGDRVECVNGYTDGEPYQGCMYTVTEVRGSYITLENVTGNWNPERFRLA